MFWTKCLQVSVNDFVRTLRLQAIPVSSAWHQVAIALREALDALVFPWSCAICGEEGSDSPFCRSCRQGLLEQSARTTASACPRCALSAGPFADLRGGCAVCRDRSLGFDAALALGPYNGDVQDLCLRLKHESNAWLAPWLVIFSSRHGAMQSATCHEMPGSCRSRCTGGGAGGEVITRPRH